MRIDFCLPIRNEAQVLEVNLSKLLAYLEALNLNYDWKIIGAINGSNDGSLSILQKFKDKFPDKIDYLEIAIPGKGRAVKACWGQSRADILAFMDADLAVSLEGVNQLINPILETQADLVIGSRFIVGASAERSWQRGFISKSYALFSRAMLGHDKSDLQCGFKAINRQAYQKIVNFLNDDFWFLDTELVVVAGLAGLRVKEIAVAWQENRRGKNKSNVHVLQDGWDFVVKILMFRRQLPKIKKYFDNV
jgi:glycosyltransferase involved in cell wall biosynthesis